MATADHLADLRNVTIEALLLVLEREFGSVGPRTPSPDADAAA